MIDIERFQSISCKMHPQSPLQFVCLEPGCKQNTFCDFCIADHPHHKSIAVKMLNQLLKDLDTRQLDEKIENYNKSKAEYLTNFKEFLNKLQAYFDDLTTSDCDKVINIFQTQLRIGGESDVISYIKKLSQAVDYNKGKLHLKAVDVPQFTGSLDDLKNKIDSIFNDHFIATLKKQKFRIIPVEPEVPQLLQTMDSKPKITFISKIIKSQTADFDVQKIEAFVFENNNNFQITNKGKIVDVQQTMSKDKNNRVAYLTPNISHVGYASVSFKYIQRGYSAVPLKFGIYTCDVGKDQHPQQLSNNNSNAFHLFEQQLPNGSQKEILLQMKFYKVSMTLELTDQQKILYQKRIDATGQLIFCFVLQPGNRIEILG